MPERLSRLPDAALEAALVDVGRLLDLPPEPNVAPAVYRAIRDARAPVPRPGVLERLVARRRIRLAVALAAALVVLIAGAAVAGLLGVPGLRVIVRPNGSPTAPATLGPVGRHLFLGNPLSLGAARTRVAFPLEQPSLPGLPAPEVYWSPIPSGGRVTFAYRASRALPAAPSTHVGLLLTEFEGSINPAFLQKTVIPPARARSVSVNGSPGMWISGAPHELVLVDRRGRPFPDTVHLAGNTLVWTNGSLTLRLEGAFGLREALRIARSVR